MSNDHAQRFFPAPASLDAESFLQRFGGVYEHSPWIARQLADQGLSEKHNHVDTLASELAAVVNNESRERQIELIRAHPDLGGRAAIRGELTAASNSEQASAGIDQCSVWEYLQFRWLNFRYRKKFGVPFVMAVAGSNRHDILAAFRRRLRNSADSEIATALAEVHKIAKMRLQRIADSSEAGSA